MIPAVMTCWFLITTPYPVPVVIADSRGVEYTAWADFWGEPHFLIEGARCRGSREIWI